MYISCWSILCLGFQRKDLYYGFFFSSVLYAYTFCYHYCYTDTHNCNIKMILLFCSSDFTYTLLGETVYCATSIHDNIRTPQVICCWISCVNLDWGKYLLIHFKWHMSHEVWRWKQLWPNWKYNFDILSRSHIPLINKIWMYS